MRILGRQPVRVIDGAPTTDKAWRNETDALDAGIRAGGKRRLRDNAHSTAFGYRIDLAAELVGGDERTAEGAKGVRRHRQPSFQRWGGSSDHLHRAAAVDREDDRLAARLAAYQQGGVRTARRGGTA